MNEEENLFVFFFYLFLFCFCINTDLYSGNKEPRYTIYSYKNILIVIYCKFISFKCLNTFTV